MEEMGSRSLMGKPGQTSTNLTVNRGCCHQESWSCSRVEIAGIVQQPDGQLMQQIALLRSTGVKTVKLPVERNHQGLDNRLISKPRDAPDLTSAVECRERLGGILNYYYREAA
jgi:hypothetical protein